MSLYQEEELEQLVVDFGGGRTLTFKMRSLDMNVGATRRIAAHAKQAEMVTARIKRLENRVSMEDMKPEEFTSVMDELDKLRQRPDGLTMAIDYIFSAACGWTNYYASKQAEEAGTVLPFNRENIETMGSVSLWQVCEKLNEYFGEKRSILGEAQSTSLQPESPSADRASLYRSSSSS